MSTFTDNSLWETNHRDITIDPYILDCLLHHTDNFALLKQYLKQHDWQNQTSDVINENWQSKLITAFKLRTILHWWRYLTIHWFECSHNALNSQKKLDVSLTDMHWLYCIILFKSWPWFELELQFEVFVLLFSLNCLI